MAGLWINFLLFAGCVGLGATANLWYRKEESLKIRTLLTAILLVLSVICLQNTNLF